jgi:hypothetical protein
MKTAPCYVLRILLIFLAACGPIPPGEEEPGVGGDGVVGGTEAPPPSLLTEAIPAAQAGRAYRLRLEARGGQPPLRWRLNSAEPPLAWLSMDAASGELAGTPSTLTGGRFVVQVTDALERSATRQFLLAMHRCQENEISICHVAGEGPCREGQQRCTGGQFSACEPMAPSSSRAACGPSCGACGSNADRCTGGECRCGGTAACAGSTPDCCPSGAGATCVDTQRNPDFCGSGCQPCPTFRNVRRECRSGTCATDCAPGFARCPLGSSTPHCDTSIRSDPNNCGGCGRRCAPEATNGSRRCEDMQCRLTCNTGFADCNQSDSDGCESSLRSLQHCGRCGNACPPPPVGGTMNCNSGQCTPICPPGHQLCGNQCVRLDDLLHCGGCNRPCPATAANATVSCMNGRCTLSCQRDWADCNGRVEDGCEVNTRIHTEHCGGCGRSCSDSPAACVEGVCCVDCGGFGSPNCCAPRRCVEDSWGVACR